MASIVAAIFDRDTYRAALYSHGLMIETDSFSRSGMRKYTALSFSYYA